jgi:hypothetical protein
VELVAVATPPEIGTPGVAEIESWTSLSLFFLKARRAARLEVTKGAKCIG